VTKREEVAAAIDEAETRIGPIDILVNNAGIQRRAPLETFSANDWDDLLRVNLDGAFHVSQAVARHMLARSCGKIINICSVQGELARPGIAPYAATKGAIRMLTKACALNGPVAAFRPTRSRRAISPPI
jgi:gluconate 5-dehydrogenase